MGCWNGTCAITHLPIFHGDEVRVVLLRQGHGDIAKGFYRPTDMWIPMGIPWKAKYDDYGSVESVQLDGIETEFFREAYTRYFTIDREPIFDGKEPSVESFLDPKDPTLFDLVRDGCVRIKNRYGIGPDQYSVGMALVHEPVYCALADYTWEPFFAEKHPRFGTFAHAERLYEEANAYLKQLLDDTALDIAEPEQGLHRALRRDDLRFTTQSIFLRELLSGMGENATSFHYDLTLRIKAIDLARKDFNALGPFLADARVKDLVERLADFFILHQVMGEGRMFWSPQSGMGSQESSTNAQCLVAKTTHLMAARIAQKFEEDNG